MNSQNINELENIAQAEELEEQTVEAVEASDAPSSEEKFKIDFKNPRCLAILGLFASVCVMALGYVLMWVANLALGGAGVANSFFISSIVGRILTSLVFSVILVACIVLIVYAIKMYKQPKLDLGLRVSRVGILSNVLYFFAVFSIIDSTIIFFFSMLANSIKGLGDNVIANNYDVIVQILKFWGYEFPGLEAKVLAMEDSAWGTVLSVLFGMITLASAVYHVIVYSKVKSYYPTLSNTANGVQYDKDNKPPYILALVLGGINALCAILSIVCGAWVEGIIKLGIAGYLVSTAFVFRSYHTELRKTSAD